MDRPVEAITLHVDYGEGGMSARLVAISDGETPGRPDGRIVPLGQRHADILEALLVDVLAGLQAANEAPQ